ncbi:RNA polymerase II mediator complex subunit [Pseudocyphellaria aurata]|nr:RNA polymerase II mediator complex subunit [Pseudocyphellaria aurata]
MADPFSISLRAWPAQDASKESLPSLISRINEQRGTFRNISESTLEEEAQVVDTGETSLQDPSNVLSNVDPQDVKTRREEVSAAREEILKEVGRAYTESAHALDFVSLLLTTKTPRQAELTISPFLKQSLPLGCLETEMVQIHHKSEAEKQTDELVSVGWKIQSLDSVAESLLKSATRLEQEIERESKYWGQVLAVKEQGWSLSRLPREKHTLGVRYGFAEAHSDFHDRGLAALRRDADGNMVLDRGIRSSKDRVIRVRVLNQGKPTSSDGKVPDHAIDDLPVETLILNARNSIFDQELHHELHREARSYTGHGIRCIDDKIFIPYTNGKEIEIDLLSSTEDEASLDVDPSDNLVAGSIAISLRILLSHAHRQNLRRRSLPPPRITENKIARPVYTIIRPIVENLQHRSAVNSLQRFLNNVAEPLLAAGLTLGIDEPTCPYHLKHLLTTAAPSVLVTEACLNALDIALQSSITIYLPSGQTTIKLEVHTCLQHPYSGTSLQSSILICQPGSTIAGMPKSTQSISLAAFEHHVLHLIQLDILSLIASSRDTGDSWTNVSPHTGQLGRMNRSTGINDRISILLQEDYLNLHWQRRGRGLNLDGTQKWQASSMESSTEKEAKGLLATMREVFKDSKM